MAGGIEPMEARGLPAWKAGQANRYNVQKVRGVVWFDFLITCGKWDRTYGGTRTRTADLLLAKQTFYQLNYAPILLRLPNFQLVVQEELIPSPAAQTRVRRTRD